MTAWKIGKELVEYVQKGQNLEAIDKLYAENITSTEARADTPEMPRTIQGKAQVRGKSEWWYKTFEVNKAEARGPFPNGNQFAVYYDFETTNRETLEKQAFSEVGLYTVENNQITKEEFFYTTEE